METITLRSLTKIKKACKGQAKLKDLRAVCDEQITRIEAYKAGGEGGDDASPFFEPLRLACKSLHAPCMEEALDCVQKLIAYGYLRGTARGPASQEEDDESPGGRRSSLETRTPSTMDAIIETICACDDFDDDNVQLQVIKALLTAVTSQTCEVHEGGLLVAVRSCYNIHLVTRNAVNKTTAKATLTQMLSIVFQRMEAADAGAPVLDSTWLVDDTVHVPDYGLGKVLSSDGTNCVVQLQAWEQDDAPAQLHCTLASLRPPVPEEGRQTKVVGVDATPGAEIRDGALVLTRQDSTQFPSAHHKDAFLLFRALCKLSMKGGPAEESDSEPISMQSKVLSLELLLSVLEHAGPAFRTGPRFVGAVRQYLCVSLLKNCTSSATHVVALALRLFVALIVRFRSNLKAEIEVFISHIFLRILDSDNSTHEHKMLVLEVFHRLCADADGLVELFLSYDADFDSFDIYRNVVISLGRVVKAEQVSTTTASGEAGRRLSTNDGALRRLALSGLVAALHSLATSCGVNVGEREDAEYAQPSDALARAAPGQPRQPEVVKVLVPQELEKTTLLARRSSDDLAKHNIERLASTQVDAYDRKQRLQEDLKDGILKFNLKPKHGLASLHAKGTLDQTCPKSVAAFLLQNADRLDKTVVGDYLGKEETYQGGFCVKVLHSYGEQMDFSGLEFDVAIRHFLSGFRLPGEAQKIDRIMETFAAQYCVVNTEVFPSADVAFVLAFSVIMLQTDLHNPSVKEEKKMTKDGFTRNNRGICNGGDLDRQFLEDIFDRIKEKPITLKEDDKLREKEEGETSSSVASSMSAAFGLNSEQARKKRAEAFSKEREAMVRSSVQAIRAGSRPAFAAFRQDASTEEFVSPSVENKFAAAAKMFEVAWGPGLSAFSHALERIFHGPRPTALALRGLKISACLACALELDVAALSLVNALASFTTLDGPFKVMLPRNAACVEALLALTAVPDCAENLGSAWLPVLRVASRVAHLRLLTSGARTDDAYFSTRREDAQTAKVQADRKLQDEESARALAAHSILTDASLDELYARSTKLSAVGVERFVAELCAVSAAELSTGDPSRGAGFVLAEEDLRPGGLYDDKEGKVTPLPQLGDPRRPRVAALQRLVDVADMNVHLRPRLAWDRMWRVLAAHFARAGAHANADVATYAVDSLRQLSLKFLAKEELKAFTFQRAFLRPFERVFRANGQAQDRAPVRAYVVACLDVLVQARATKIRSGWRSILGVLRDAAGDPDRAVSQAAFEALGRVLDHHLALVAPDFVSVVGTAAAFAAWSPHADDARSATALEALARLDACARALADGSIRTATRAAASASRDGDVEPENTEHEPDGAQLELWWPLLLGLARLVADPREKVRNAALATLRRVLERDGLKEFGAETWRLVFRGVLFPCLESAWTDDAPRPASVRPTDPPSGPPPPSEASWLDTTAPAVLDCIVGLYARLGGAREHTPLLGEVLALLGDCVCQDAERLARLGVDALERLCAAVGAFSDPETATDGWNVCCRGLAHVVDRALPPALDAYLRPDPREGKTGDATALAAALPRAPTLARLVASLRLPRVCGLLLADAAKRGSLTEPGADALLGALAGSRQFAAAFDADGPLRKVCLASRLMGADAPDLVAQRVSAGAEAFAALQRAFASEDPQMRALAEPRLLGLCRDVLREYASAERRALAEKAGKSAGLPQPAQLLDSATPLALEALAFVRDLDAQVRLSVLTHLHRRRRASNAIDAT